MRWQNLMDVLLHYKSIDGSLKILVDKTEKALEDFPCRVLPVFTPWFPPESDKLLPIRPLKSPPIISLEDLENIQTHLQSAEPLLTSHPCAESIQNLALTSLGRSTLHVQACSEFGTSAQHKDTLHSEREVKRSWSVFSQRGLYIHNTQTFSKQFHKVVWRHGLHMRQRAKWVIDKLNFVTGDIEHTWRGLNRAIRNSMLPTCNANIQRDLTQICVFCDVLYCEYVGNYLKEEFQVTGQITLFVHRLGDIFTL
ncbi:shieldin complex subunit 3 [Oncorhynchus nerka]|uniref:shieldin complex subunit 3 n=1 Tax=Oncorhynchus nerka TaxID=8023 RepID=UPI001131A0D6|nr:shieldin complex subunit 3 [Oncorhynchus nerka]XP_029494502.1 shieldin complex subunit 3 [Oncorhynchus nerka]XP_029494503.1 shieldin complex subunit 3 [Oncorhynchus nerka]